MAGRPTIYATPEARRQAKRLQNREANRRRRRKDQVGRKAAGQSKFWIHPNGVERVRPTAAVLAEREIDFMRWAAFEPTANVIVLGDPPPWRSALHQRGDQR